MKRLRMWLRELSLTQQLISIIFLFVLLFACFVLLFLSPAIDKFSETEMYRVLHDSQEDMIFYLKNTASERTNRNARNAAVTDVLYSRNTDTFTILAGSKFPQSMEDYIRENYQGQVTGTIDDKMTYTEEDHSIKTYIFCVSELDGNNLIISLVSDAYRMEFRTSLINGIVIMNVLIVSVLLVLLLIWVGSLIIPLSQIRSYITKIKNDDPSAVLGVERNDEIGAVADALRDMEQELAQQNRKRQEMIQNISHDLKTPIATIRSYGESIKDGIYPYDTLEKSVDVIIEHADRLEKKVKSLIILNKMGYLLDDCEPGDNLDMNQVIEKVLLSLKVIRPEVSFIQELESGVKFHGEEEPWRITVENLIDNALRYADSYIRIVLRKNELEIINDGRRIDEDKLETLFKPYEKGTGGQFGLGLSIVYQVVTTYGYRVSAENLQEGVRFRIWKELTKKEKRKEKKGDA